MKSEKTVAFALAVAGAIAAGTWLTGCSDDSKGAEPGETLKVSRKIAEAAGRESAAERSRRSEQRVDGTKKIKRRFLDDGDSEDAAWLAERKKKVDAILELMQELAKDGKTSPGRISRVEALEKILDLGDRNTALSLARKMRLSDNRVERAAALDAFGWFGSKGMADVTSMLADPDPELAAEAFEAWQTSLNEISDDSLRCELIVDAAKLVENDPEMATLMMELTQIDSTAMAVETLDKIIIAEDSTAAAKDAARDIYQHLCDADYTDHETAVQKAAQIREEDEKIDPERAAQLRALFEKAFGGSGNQ